jgi:hypothetical protein
MATTLKATGDFLAGTTPTLTISSGRGNTTAPEIHVILRDDTDGESSRTIMGWFDRNELLAAIDAADRKVRLAVETGEPS